MQVVIRLELDGDKVGSGELLDQRDVYAIRECVYSYLEELIQDDTLDYEIHSVDFNLNMADITEEAFERIRATSGGPATPTRPD